LGENRAPVRNTGPLFSGFDLRFLERLRLSQIPADRITLVRLNVTDMSGRLVCRRRLADLAAVSRG